MGSILRSEEMMLLQLLLQSDSAYACVRELGEVGKVEFKDLNADVSAFQRKFVNELRRCDEMERMLRFFVSELEKTGIPIAPAPAQCPAPDPHLMIDYETQFENNENSIKQLKSNQESLKKNLLDLKELKQVLSKAQTFFQEGEQVLAEAYVQQAVAGAGGGGGGGSAPGTEMKTYSDAESAAAAAETKFTFLIGVVPTENLLVFVRVLWRVCRGNLFVKHAQIDETLEDPVTGNPVLKSVFILFFQGEQLNTRIKKLCDGFRATLYACPETAPERQQVRLQVAARIEEVEGVLQNTTSVKDVALRKIAQSVEEWQQKVKKIKAIYHAMNMFNLDIGHQSLVAECWCPVKDFHLVQEALNKGTLVSGSPISAIVNRISTPESPPTYYKVNKFTTGFQAIVESYGIASYRELNPTPYAIITFPFLFGVMFGDIGHGIMMFLFACVLIAFEKKLAKTKEGGEFLSIVFSGRYLLLLMGLFSIYTGVIYNGLYSRTTNVFGSAWRPYYYGVNRTTFYSVCAPINGEKCHPGNDNVTCNSVYSTGLHTERFPTEAQLSYQPYPFGIDPMWMIAKNKLTFTNSYKMKMSIILGLFQLMFGVVLSIINNIKSKSYIGIIGESIPRVIFLMNLIGWLVFLMLFKWCKYYPDATKAPNLLLTLIYMFLDFGNSPTPPLYSVFGTGPTETAVQRYLQIILVITAVVCVPWMLLVKPIYTIVQNKRAEKKAQIRSRRSGSQGGLIDGHESSGEESLSDKSDMEMSDIEKAELVARKEKAGEEAHPAGGHGGHGQGPGEILVLSAIHTIEYCLGAISNTASYLRLWALSLAHEQLSEVLWQYAIAKYNITMFGSVDPILGSIVMFALWAGWAVLTVGILLILEGLSAFLHALRLHWIEFQNKFYEGEGRKFKPLSFAAVLAGEEDE